MSELKKQNGTNFFILLDKNEEDIENFIITNNLLYSNSKYDDYIILSSNKENFNIQLSNKKKSNDIVKYFNSVTKEDSLFAINFFNDTKTLKTKIYNNENSDIILFDGNISSFDNLTDIYNFKQEYKANDILLLYTKVRNKSGINVTNNFIDILNRIQGEFSFIIYDNLYKKLIVYRRNKPLYYIRNKGLKLFTTQFIPLKQQLISSKCNIIKFPNDTALVIDTKNFEDVLLKETYRDKIQFNRNAYCFIIKKKDLNKKNIEQIKKYIEDRKIDIELVSLVILRDALDGEKEVDSSYFKVKHSYKLKYLDQKARCMDSFSTHILNYLDSDQLKYQFGNIIFLDFDNDLGDFIDNLREKANEWNFNLNIEKI